MLGISFLRSCILLVSISCFTWALPVEAQAQTPGGPLGMGIVLGDPAGLSVRLDLNPQNAIQLHLGIDLESFDRTRLSVAADYLFRFGDLFKSEKPQGSLKPYVGLGATTQLRELSDDVRLGVRLPVGLSFRFAHVPLELFGEAALGIHVLPKTATLIDGGLGLRWYF